MPWSDEMVVVLRYMIADFTEPITYSDNDLQGLVLTGAQLMQSETEFDQYYNISVPSLTITPDPTLSPRNDVFINLSLLKAASVVDYINSRYAAKKAVLMQDSGGKMVDARSIVQAMIAIWKQGWAKQYSEARFQYLAGSVTAGQAIIGPFRQYIGYAIGPWLPDGGYGSYGYPAIGNLFNDGRYR